MIRKKGAVSGVQTNRKQEQSGDSSRRAVSGLSCQNMLKRKSMINEELIIRATMRNTSVVSKVYPEVEERVRLLWNSSCSIKKKKAVRT